MATLTSDCVILQMKLLHSEKKISKEKLVRKTLRSLMKKFAIKVIAIEEAKNMSTMKLEELVGLLERLKYPLRKNYPQRRIEVWLRKVVTRTQMKNRRKIEPAGIGLDISLASG